MRASTRREFLADVGKGMLIAGLGPALAADLGLARAEAGEAEPNRLNFGVLEPLVAMMQETPLNQLLPALVEKYRTGTDLRTLTAAALANARTFGGHDYIGFHTIMALVPAYEMAKRLPEDRRPLPVFKVLYRNTSRIQDFGGVKQEVLHPIEAGQLPAGRDAGELLRAATRKADVNEAELPEIEELFSRTDAMASATVENAARKAAVCRCAEPPKLACQTAKATGTATRKFKRKPFAPICCSLPSSNYWITNQTTYRRL